MKWQISTPGMADANRVSSAAVDSPMDLSGKRRQALATKAGPGPRLCQPQLPTPRAMTVCHLGCVWGACLEIFQTEAEKKRFTVWTCGSVVQHWPTVCEALGWI